MAVVAAGLTAAGCVDYVYMRRFAVGPVTSPQTNAAQVVQHYVTEQGYTACGAEGDEQSWRQPGYPVVDLQLITNETYRMDMWTGMCGRRDVRRADKFARGLLRQLEGQGFIVKDRGLPNQAPEDTARKLADPQR